MKRPAKPKRPFIFILILVVIGLLAAGIWHYWLNSPLSFSKKTYTYINNLPLPNLDNPAYSLIRTDSDPGSLPSQDYLTNRTGTQVLSDMSSLCKLYGFTSAGTSGGPTTINGVSFGQTTLQCSKGNNGWQFDIDTFSSLAALKSYESGAKLPAWLKTNQSKYIDLVVSSGPLLCEGMGPCS